MQPEVYIARMDKGFDSELFREQLKKIPSRLLKIAKVAFYLVHSPLNCGIIIKDTVYNYGRYSFLMSDSGGWFATEEHTAHAGLKPQIYIARGCEKRSTKHEIGHAVDHALGFPSRELFRPELSMWDYAKHNNREYFAYAFDIYFGDDISGRMPQDLFDADPQMYKYLENLSKS